MPLDDKAKTSPESAQTQDGAVPRKSEDSAKDSDGASVNETMDALAIDQAANKLEQVVARVRDLDGTLEASVDDEQPTSEEASPQAALIRDSTFLIAAGTALLYLISLAFGNAYLRFFDISGFQTFGLGALGLLDQQALLILVVFAFGVRATLRTAKVRRFAVGLGMIFVVGAAKPATILAYGNPVAAADLDAFLSATVIVVVLGYRWRHLGPHTAKLQDSLTRTGEVIRLVRRAGLQSMPELNGVRKVAKYFTGRVSEIRGMSWMASGYITLFVAIPSLAWFTAATAAEQSGYRSVDTLTAPRVPVYWIGDRVVFLTFDKACFVHTQIAGVLLTKRSCGRDVHAVLDTQ